MEHQLNPEITVASQPGFEQLQELSSRGFKTIVNFRNSGEDETSLSPEAEGHEVARLGLKYVHLPVTMKAMSAEQVDKFLRQYPELPKPIYAHCKSAKRAGAMALMKIAMERGWTGTETLQQAEQLGIDCDQPELEEFIRSYVDARSNSTASTI